MLTVENLQKAYEKPVIQNLSLSFPEKGLFLIRGESGCGKTTLLRLIAGLEKADGGSIRLEKDKKISFVFQEARLVPHLTLMENLILVKEKSCKEEALAILEQVGLGEDAKKFPHQLSGGMRLRGAIARSLYYGGDVFLWDEPTKEVDPENREKIITLAKKLSEKALVIAVTHDPFFTGGEEIFLA